MKKIILFTTLFFYYSLPIFGQENASSETDNSLPPSSTINLDSPPQIEMPAFDIQAMIDEDEENASQGIGSNRFAKGFEVNYTMDNSGAWDVLENGDEIWRIGFKSKDAYSLNIIFKNFNIPDGASMYIYNKTDTPEILGPYTFDYNPSDGILPTPPVAGEEIYIEYLLPKDILIRGNFTIQKISHEYSGTFTGGNGESAKQFNQFNKSLPCNICVNDLQATEWEIEKRAVVRLVYDGETYGSGALINNTNNNKQPLILTANHNLSTQSSISRVIAYFNYENACDNNDGTQNLIVLGGDLRATRSESDFTLFQLRSRVPSSYRPYYAGWDNRDIPPTSAVSIHHPQGDVKKISFEDDIVESEEPISISFSGVPTSFASDVLWRMDIDRGATEGGSSGAPWFNQDKRIIGQHTGGRVNCAPDPDAIKWAGKLSESWNVGSNSNERLDNWLDPENTNVATLDGISPRGWRHDWLAGWNPPADQKIHSGSKSLEGGEGGMLFYRGRSDNRIHSYYYSNSTNSWRHTYISDWIGSNNKLIDGDLAVGVGQIFYRGRDGKMQTYFWQPSTNWTHDYVHQINNVSNICGAILVGHGNQIFYRGNDDRLHSFYFIGGQYVHTTISSSDNSRRIDGDLTINKETNQIFYRGRDGKMHTYFWSNGWQHLIINTPENISRACGALTANDKSLFYRGTDNRIYRISKTGESWTFAGVLGNTNDKKVAGSIEVGREGTQLFYRGTDGKVHTYYEGSGIPGNYIHDYIEASWQAPVIHNISGPLTIGDARIFYRGTGGEINSYFWDNTGFRSDENLYGMEEAELSPTIPSRYLKDFNIEVDIYPNPTEGAFTVAFKLNASQAVSIELFDMMGRIISNPLKDQYLPYGLHKMDIDFSTMSRGTYLCKIKSKDFNTTKKIMVLK